MMRNTWWMALGLMIFVGCNNAESNPANVNAAPSGTAATPAPGGGPTPGNAEATAVTLSQGEIDEIKKLPEAEQAAALEQKVCPISGEHLGSMGVPIKVTAGDKSAYLCCKGCKEDFEKDPQAALNKLTQK